MKSLWTFFFFFFNAQITIAFMLKYNPQKIIKIRPRKSSLELAFCVLINPKEFSKSNNIPRWFGYHPGRLSILKHYTIVFDRKQRNPLYRTPALAIAVAKSVCQHHQGIKIQEDSNEEDPWSCLSWVRSGLTPLSSWWSWKLWKASQLHQNQNLEKGLKTI